MYSKTQTLQSIKSSSEVERLRRALDAADAVIIGAGAGLSTSAGFEYSGARFERYFADFGRRYGFADMYSGGFYEYPTPEVNWAYWSRFIYINRYMAAPKPVYEQLHALMAGRDYFVLTTNVDHCFQKAGFDRQRLFYTQGDYGLFQCSRPCHDATYDNADTIRAMVEAQGYVIGADGALELPAGATPRMEVPAELVPRCPVCGAPMTTNLRADDRFVEDAGWRAAAQRYAEFVRAHSVANVLLLELAVGYNTPGIIKYNFWRMAYEWERAMYACVNYGQAMAPSEIGAKSICIDADAGAVIGQLISGAQCTP